MRIHLPLNNPRMSTWSRLIMIEIPMMMIPMKKGILSKEGLCQRQCHPKLVPKSPPPTLRLVSKVKPAPKNTLDDETESDNHPGDRPALPRRPVMRPVLTSNDWWFNIWIGYEHQPPEGIRAPRTIRKLKIPDFCARVRQGMLNHPRCQSGFPLRILVEGKIQRLLASDTPR